MERGPHYGRTSPPRPAGRSHPGGLSFEQPRTPPPYPEHSHQEGRFTLPRNEPFQEAVQPRVLFDHRNPEHAKWFREQLKEVRESSFALGSLTAALGLVVVTISGSLHSIEPSMAAMGVPGVALGMLLTQIGARELRAAIAKMKMKLTDDRD